MLDLPPIMHDESIKNDSWKCQRSEERRTNCCHPDNTDLSMLEKLPNELLLSIFKLYCEELPDEYRATLLSSASMLSKTINGAVTPFLYQKYSDWGKPDSLEKFVRTTAQHPELAKYIRHLDLQQPSRQSFDLRPWTRRRKELNADGLWRHLLTIQLAAEDSPDRQYRMSGQIDYQSMTFRTLVGTLFLIARNVQAISLSASNNDANILVHVASHAGNNRRMPFLLKLKEFKLHPHHKKAKLDESTVISVLNIPNLQKAYINFFKGENEQNYIWKRQPFSTTGSPRSSNIKHLHIEGALPSHTVMAILKACSSLDSLSLDTNKRAKHPGIREFIEIHKTSLKSLEITTPLWFRNFYICDFSQLKHLTLTDRNSLRNEHPIFLRQAESTLVPRCLLGQKLRTLSLEVDISKLEQRYKWFEDCIFNLIHYAPPRFECFKLKARMHYGSSTYQCPDTGIETFLTSLRTKHFALDYLPVGYYLLPSQATIILSMERVPDLLSTAGLVKWDTPEDFVEMDQNQSKYLEMAESKKIVRHSAIHTEMEPLLKRLKELC